MNKRLIAAILALAMALTLLPTAALAAEATSVWVGAVELEDGYYTTDGVSSADTTLPGDGYAYFSTATGKATLTLKNFRYSGEGHAGYCIFISGSGDLTIVLADGSNNTVTSTVDTAIRCPGKLVISGSGELTAESDSSSSASGISVSGDIEVAGATVTGNSVSPSGGSGYGVSGDSITVTGGTLKGTSSSDNGVLCRGALTLSGSAALEGTSEKSTGVSCYGNITVSDAATLKATGGENSSSHGLYVNGSLAVSGGSVTGKSDAAATDGFGIYCSSVSVTGGTVTASSARQAVARAPVLSGYAYVATASEDPSGTPQVSYDPDDYQGYKYFHVEPAALTISDASDITFPAGASGRDHTVTVGHGTGLAADDIGDLTLDGRDLILDTDYTKETASSVNITLKERWLNSLTAGTHRLNIPVTSGAYAPQTLSVNIVVTASGSAGGDADVPKTGDGSMPGLWAGLALLAGAGLCVNATHHRKRQHRN